MSIVEKVITKFIEKVLRDMENLTDNIGQEKDISVIELSRQDMKNKEVYKKLFARQTLLNLLKVF